MYAKEHLGSLLVKAGILSEVDLELALKHAEATEQRLGEVLIAKGLTTEDQIQQFISIQLGYPPVRLDHTVIEPEVARQIPEKFARRYGILPLYRAESEAGSVVVVAMTDPANIMVQDELRRALGEIFVTLASQGEMSRYLDKVWAASPSEEAATVGANVMPQTAEEVKPSIALILEMLFKQAFEMRATSIHLEPKQKFVAVRYKVDGQYHSVTSLPKDAYQAVLTRIKILSKMPLGESVIDLAEGRFHIRPDLSQPFIDVRVTIVPAIFGEKAVMKVTRRDDIIRACSDVGFEAQQWPVVTELLKKPTGLLVISGKNDSGKTTLAYSLLSQIGDPSNMVVTIEDPPAYPISSFNQVAKLRASTTDPTVWEQTLKAVERQEPNIVYISSVDTRHETKMMLRLASTGRRVVATLFADDATSSHWVPFQLGADPFAVASALSGVIACRLLRRICESCRRESTPSAELLRKLALPSDFAAGKKLYEGAGCDKCGGSGYLGRIGVYEVMLAYVHLKEMIESKTASDLIRKAAIESGMMTLRDAALAKAERGVTTLAEIAAHIE